jgi:hypothetical protein
MKFGFEKKFCPFQDWNHYRLAQNRSGGRFYQTIIVVHYSFNLQKLTTLVSNAVRSRN